MTPFREILRRGCLLLAGSAPLIGCGETSGQSVGVGGIGGDAAEMVSHFLQVRELPIFTDIVPIEGARVCVLGAVDCVTTDAEGLVELRFPPDQEVAFTVETEGYGSWVFANVTDDRFPEEGTAEMTTVEALSEIAAQLGITYPWKQGMVGLQRWPSRAGVRFVPVGSTVDAVGEPFYFDASTLDYSLELTATTDFVATPYFQLASGGFTEVAPGVQQFELAGAAGECASSWAWPGDAPNRIRIPVLEGFTTYGSMICD